RASGEQRLFIALPTFWKSARFDALPTQLRRRWGGRSGGHSSQLPFFGDDGSALKSEQIWANCKGDYAVLYILKQAADAIVTRQKSKAPGFTESLYARHSLQSESKSAALNGVTLSQLDAGFELIEATTERMADLLPDHREQAAISLGNDLAASSAGVPDAEETSSTTKLEILIGEQKKEGEE
ncbi:hypothetical protein FS837_000775, partial [Tulasnella sp. UAMH 9824]